MSESQINEFRRNFALVWRTWRARGEISEAEMTDGIKQAGAAVKANMKNLEWMRGAMAHFAELADAIRHDQERADRIRAEERERRAA